MRKRSHRERRRLRATRHPGRAAQAKSDAQVRQEIARLRELYARTSDDALLREIEVWKETLDRSQPMPRFELPVTYMLAGAKRVKGRH